MIETSLSTVLAAEEVSTPFQLAGTTWPDFAWLIPVFPFVAFFVILFFGKRMRTSGTVVGIVAIAASLVVSLGVFSQAYLHPGFVEEKKVILTPFGDGRLTLGMKVDGLAALMFVIVCLVSLLVQVYSTSYMDGDSRYTFFFAMLSLFTTGMLIVTIADNLMLMLVGWEIMGVCSYFLIGHFWEETPNSNAAIKAFLTTRVGDVGFMIGIFILFWGAQSFEFSTIIERAESGEMPRNLVVAGTVAIFFGAVGKSAQFPLHTWLPDAMAGPTPVSALIHAATMVASGIYMVARLYPVFELSGPALNLIGVLAAITMTMAALIALVQDDIKKVLAYSTVSQLAYMTAGLAVGGYTAGFFHLLTHAAFKGLLFLGAGSVIHAVHSNNMSEMGGLRRYLPRTHATYLVGCIALAGIPPLAGFWSKDEVILDAYWAAGFGHPHEDVATSPIVGKMVFASAVVTAVLTAFYVTRMYCLTWLGTYRGKGTPHESSAAMTVPLMVLTVPAAVLGFWGSPLWPDAHNIKRVVAFAGQPYHAPELLPIVAGTSVALAVLGVVVGFAIYGKGLPRRDPTLHMGLVTKTLQRKFFLDDLYLHAIVRPTRSTIAAGSYWLNQHVFDAPPNLAGKGAVLAGRAAYAVDRNVIDGTVNGSGRTASFTGRALALVQNGNVQAYATGMFVGVLALAVAFAAR
ncbi:MAG TPA: NADH-quinone oxidoreductase subunit L [Mycobacteriales bacterium]|nr:NADH-quinone oxidoreductase subunit L [Mycobacteriales bacterium]